MQNQLDKSKFQLWVVESGSFGICKCMNMSQMVCQYLFETEIGSLETSRTSS